MFFKFIKIGKWIDMGIHWYTYCVLLSIVSQLKCSLFKFVVCCCCFLGINCKVLVGFHSKGLIYESLQ